MQWDPHQPGDNRKRRWGNSITYLLLSLWRFFAPHHMGFQLLPLSQVRSLGLELVARIPEEGSTSCSTHTPESCTVCQSNNESARNFFINYSNCPWPPLGAPHLQPEQLLEPRCLSLRINQYHLRVNSCETLEQSLPYYPAIRKISVFKSRATESSQKKSSFGTERRTSCFTHHFITGSQGKSVNLPVVHAILLPASQKGNVMYSNLFFYCSN